MLLISTNFRTRAMLYGNDVNILVYPGSLGQTMILEIIVMSVPFSSSHSVRIFAPYVFLLIYHISNILMVHGLYSFIYYSNLFITAAGNSLLESALLGSKAITFASHSNQLNTLQCIISEYSAFVHYWSSPLDTVSFELNSFLAQSKYRDAKIEYDSLLVNNIHSIFRVCLNQKYPYVFQSYQQSNNSLKFVLKSIGRARLEPPFKTRLYCSINGHFDHQVGQNR